MPVLTIALVRVEETRAFKVRMPFYRLQGTLFSIKQHSLPWDAIFGIVRALMETRSLLFLGDGSFAVEALDIAEAAGGFKPLVFVNSLNPPVPGSRLEGLPVFWIDEIPFGVGECYVVCAITTTRRRPFIETIRDRGYRFTSLIHPAASVSRRARVRDGCILNAGVVVGSNADIGEDTIVNRGALIGHDNLTGKCCTIGPGANVGSRQRRDRRRHVRRNGRGDPRTGEDWKRRGRLRRGSRAAKRTGQRYGGRNSCQDHQVRGDGH